LLCYRQLGVLIVATLTPALGSQCRGQDKGIVIEKRLVTVADAIRMTRVAGTEYPAVRPKIGFAVFAPDQKQFAIVLSKGNIEENANDYSLLVFRTADLPAHPTPRVLVSFRSSSNRPGISTVSWAGDSDTILFLGARESGATQLYSVRCSSGELRKLTNHPTSLVSYGVSEDGSVMVFAAESPDHTIINQTILRNGLDIQKESVAELISGRAINNRDHELFVKRRRSVRVQRLRTRGEFNGFTNNPLCLSPNGRFLVVKTDAMEVPSNWEEYQDVGIQGVVRTGHRKGEITGILRYELLDTRTGQSETLLDAPATFSSADVLWSPDSKSLLLCKTFLPLDSDDPVELQSRRANKFVIEIELSNLAIIKVTNEELNPVCWNSKTNVVQFFGPQKPSQPPSARQSVYFQKTEKEWHRVRDAVNGVLDWPIDILAEQDLNMPPRIIAADSRTRRETTLLDLNPQFAELAFGKVEEIAWKDGTGKSVSGGLYLPPDYVPGKRYPLVIQTHGFEPHTFVIDGTHMTATAAQPLAGKGIAVLQIRDIFYESLVTPQEADRVMSAYENAVEYLDQKGVVDTNRVGISGFSRTCYYVKYTLTHSKKHFGAAIVADGFDGGYFQYLMSYNVDPSTSLESDRIIGGSPFGPGLSLWFKNSPGFLLDKVQTPLQIQALGPNSILAEWQWFEGLKRLGKPVDMVYLPTASHVLVKPWDRLVSQEGTLDWFCFWLKGEENPNREKAEQYARWRKLRIQYEKSSRLD